MTARTRPAPTRRRALLTVLVSLAACAGGASDTTSGGLQGGGTVTLASPTTSLNLIEGATQNVTLNVTRTNYTAPLTLSVNGLPTGVTAVFNPATLSGATLSSTLTLTAALDAPIFQGSIVILVSGGDSTSASISITFQVLRPQVIVSRNGTGTGTVTSNPAGINCGAACSTTFQAGTNVTLTATPANGSAFAGWSGGGCSGTNATCSFTLTGPTPVTATFNSTSQSFSVAVNPPSASVPQGGNTTATAILTRVNGYAGTVTLTITGAPSGLTITAPPPSTTDTSATLNIAATSAVPAGNYPIGISATGAGIAGAQTTTLNLQVTPGAGGTGDLAFSYAACDSSTVPIWLAVQNGTGTWARVMPTANNVFVVTIGATGGIAFVTPDGPGFSTSVLYANHNEIQSLALGSQCRGVNAESGSKSLTGSITGVVSTGLVNVSIGGANVQAHPSQNPAFTIDNVPAGRRDLLAVVNVPNPNGSISFPRLILRRDMNYSTSIPQLDFNTEYVVPTLKLITTSNLGSDQTAAEASFVTTNGSSAPYLSVQGGPNGNVGYAGVPDALLQPGDLHAITIFAASASGSSGRLAVLLHHSVVDDAVAFGPALNQPSVTSLGTSPTLRLHTQLVSQPEYNAVVDAQFDQGANSVDVTSTAGYVGATPATWTVDIPDLTSAGYNPAWGLKTGSSVGWQVFAGGGSFLPLLGASPVDGYRVLGAIVANTSASFNRFRSVELWTRRRSR